MKDSDAERIKHRANYLNGMAIVFFAGGVLGPILTHMAASEQSWGLLALLFITGTGTSISLHVMGNQMLGALDRDNRQGE